MCERWEEERVRLGNELGAEQITPGNIITLMLRNSQSWCAVAAFAECILRRKNSDSDELINSRRN